jgi:hypothetical protein
MQSYHGLFYKHKCVLFYDGTCIKRQRKISPKSQIKHSLVLLQRTKQKLITQVIGEYFEFSGHNA